MSKPVPDPRDESVGRCKACGQILPATISDEAIVASLATGSTAMLYAAADPRNSKLGDPSRWFVSGPKGRPGYVEGPFTQEQVQRITRRTDVHMLCRDAADQPCAYVHRQYAHRWPATLSTIRKDG